MSKKKIIMIALPAVVIAAAVLYFFVIRGKAEGKAKLPDPVDSYTLQGESVASITTAVEEGQKEVLLSVSAGGEAEGETADTADTSDTSEASDKEDESSEKKGEASQEDSSEETEENNDEWHYYYYRISPNSEEAVEKYENFLSQEGFKPVTEDKDFKQPVSQYAQAYQKSGETEGRLLVVEVEYPMEGNANTGLYSIKVRIEEKPQLKPVTRDETLKYFKGLDPKILGLEKPIEDYSVIMDMGRTIVDGKECYGISLYEKGASDESYFIKKFYLSLADKKLYEYLNGDIVGMQQNKSVSDKKEGPAIVEDY